MISPETIETVTAKTHIEEPCCKQAVRQLSFRGVVKESKIIDSSLRSE